MSPFCTNCGHELDTSWNVCPECGKVLKEGTILQNRSIKHSQLQSTTQTTPQPQQVQPYRYRTTQVLKENKFGPASLVCGILGLIYSTYLSSFLIGFGFPIFRIAAIILGALGISKDENKSMAIVGLVLGVSGVLLYFMRRIS